MARQAEGHPLRQRPGVHQWRVAGLGRQAQHPDRSYPAGQAATERLRRTLQSNGTLRLAHSHLFESIDQVQDAATRWLWTYNHERPNMALGGITPMQKLALLLNSTFESLKMGGLP